MNTDQLLYDFKAAQAACDVARDTLDIQRQRWSVLPDTTSAPLEKAAWDAFELAKDHLKDLEQLRLVAWHNYLAARCQLRYPNR